MEKSHISHHLELTTQVYFSVVNMQEVVILNNLTLGNDIFLGKWKEDQSKRQNLNDFLYYRGITWIKRSTAVNSANWWLTMNIARNGNIYAFDGKSMYLIIYLSPFRLLDAALICG